VLGIQNYPSSNGKSICIGCPKIDNGFIVIAI